MISANGYQLAEPAASRSTSPEYRQRCLHTSTWALSCRCPLHPQLDELRMPSSTRLARRCGRRAGRGRVVFSGPVVRYATINRFQLVPNTIPACPALYLQVEYGHQCRRYISTRDGGQIVLDVPWETTVRPVWLGPHKALLCEYGHTPVDASWRLRAHSCYPAVQLSRLYLSKVPTGHPTVV